MRDYLFHNRAGQKQYMKNVDPDVEMIKKVFRNEIGADWRTATRVNSKSKLGIKGKSAAARSVARILTRPPRR